MQSDRKLGSQREKDTKTAADSKSKGRKMASNSGENNSVSGISVLMSVYRKEKCEYFRQSMESILNQSLAPDEIVLIEDGELTPELENLIRHYQNLVPNLVCYRFPQNVQLGRALQKGVTLCRNELIARMDTDDIAKEDRLESQRDFMAAHPHVAVCGGWMEEFSDDGTVRRIKKMPEHNEEIRRYARKRNPLNHMTVMFRKSKVLEAGNYVHFPLLEDYHLWSRMLAKGFHMYNLPKVLVCARTNEGIYERRGGIGYMRRYLGLRRFQRKTGLLGRMDYIKAVVVTAGITVIPPKARKIIYKTVLRR